MFVSVMYNNIITHMFSLLILLLLSSQSSFLLLQLPLLLLNPHTTHASMPSTWDIQAMYPLCRAWKPFTQGYCGNCCSTSIATALSIRECIRDARDTHLSAAQIWDCSGPLISNCRKGSTLSAMIESIGTGSRSSFSLLPYECTNETYDEPDTTRCLQSYASCSNIIQNFTKSQLYSTVLYNIQLYNGPVDYGVVLAGHNMMSEIMKNGPVISILTLSEKDTPIFQNFTGNSIFVPSALSSFYSIKTNIINSYNNNSSSSNAMVQQQTIGSQITWSHCIVVYGWGEVCQILLILVVVIIVVVIYFLIDDYKFFNFAQDKETGIKFWLVQNSYGLSWGNKGTGRILRGANILEGAWYGISTASKPCTSFSSSNLLSSSFPKCLPSSLEHTSNGFYGGYGLLPNDKYPNSDSSTNKNTFWDTQNKNNNNKHMNKEYYPQKNPIFVSSHLDTYILPVTDNISILAISFISAIIITGLFLLVLRPIQFSGLRI